MLADTPGNSSHVPANVGLDLLCFWETLRYMKVAGLLVCLLATAVAVYPESPVKGTASRTTSVTNVQPGNLDTPLLTEEIVRGWLTGWQRRLGLEDWKIEANIV